MLMITVGKTFTFDSAHFLPGHERCGATHGHTWEVTVEVEGPMDEKGFVLDFHILNEKMHTILSMIDHKLINDLVSPPTCEKISFYLFYRVKNCLRSDHKDYELKSLKVQEGKGGYAICRG